jgi:hypothetical protein
MDTFRESVQDRNHVFFAAIAGGSKSIHKVDQSTVSAIYPKSTRGRYSQAAMPTGPGTVGGIVSGPISVDQFLQGHDLQLLTVP